MDFTDPETLEIPLRLFTETEEVTYLNSIAFPTEFMIFPDWIFWQETLEGWKLEIGLGGLNNVTYAENLLYFDVGLDVTLSNGVQITTESRYQKSTGVIFSQRTTIDFGGTVASFAFERIETGGFITKTTTLAKNDVYRYQVIEYTGFQDHSHPLLGNGITDLAINSSISVEILQNPGISDDLLLKITSEIETSVINNDLKEFGNYFIYPDWDFWEAEKTLERDAALVNSQETVSFFASTIAFDYNRIEQNTSGTFEILLQYETSKGILARIEYSAVTGTTSDKLVLVLQEDSSDDPTIPLLNNKAFLTYTLNIIDGYDGPINKALEAVIGFPIADFESTEFNYYLEDISSISGLATYYFAEEESIDVHNLGASFEQSIYTLGSFVIHSDAELWKAQLEAAQALLETSSGEVITFEIIDNLLEVKDKILLTTTTQSLDIEITFRYDLEFGILQYLEVDSTLIENNQLTQDHLIFELESFNLAGEGDDNTVQAGTILLIGFVAAAIGAGYYFLRKSKA
ncbi:MAG: hypothetical protein IH840_09200 [Candidatus Heimdallarchaeota archaeon]|nr:hypothetical protein [Candidatus Heimdallarchaeota archaeon]